ncbi:TetR/AcrR family transcriptional regulator [Brucellaceae bacterium D45D]
MAVNVASRTAKSSREAIILAARKLFLKRGYDGVNLDAIAKKASVSRQTLYNNFGSKEAIFRAMLNDHWMRIRAGVDGELSAVIDPNAVEEMLRTFAQRMMSFVESADQVDFTRLVIAESRRTAWIGREFYEVGKGPLLHSFADTLETYTAAGGLRCENPLLSAHQFFGLILECVFWPYVMAIGTATSELVSAEVAIDEAVKMFVARYRHT